MIKMKYKICSRCKQEKPIVFFNKLINSKDGYQNYCKACSDEYRKNYNSYEASLQRKLRSYNDKNKY